MEINRYKYIQMSLQRQAGSLAYAYGGIFRNEPAKALAEFLTVRSPGLNRAYFLSSGSEIMEIAVKTTLRYFVELGQPSRRFVISRCQSYHGRLGRRTPVLIRHAGARAWRVYDAIASNSGMLRNGPTFAFHATACATALAMQNIVEEEGLLAKVQLRGRMSINDVGRPENKKPAFSYGGMRVTGRSWTSLNN
jgi:adenosylmethionine-8-amino-7-oxononanoate aminotransferase